MKPHGVGGAPVQAGPTAHPHQLSISDLFFFDQLVQALGPAKARQWVVQQVGRVAARVHAQGLRDARRRPFPPARCCSHPDQSRVVYCGHRERRRGPCPLQIPRRRAPATALLITTSQPLAHLWARQLALGVRACHRAEPCRRYTRICRALFRRGSMLRRDQGARPQPPQQDGRKRSSRAADHPRISRQAPIRPKQWGQG